MRYTKYVFYDIECANCRNYTAKISNIGYVITDTQFNIIDSKEIKINPEAPFYSYEKIGGKEVRERYVPKDIDEYLASSNYKDIYNEIKELFTMEDTLYIGFGNLSDAYFLYESNKRYGLINFNYKFIDLKDIFQWRYDKKVTKQYKGLKGLADFFNIEWNQVHNCLEDSLMTYKTCKALMKKCKNIQLVEAAKLANAIYEAKESKVFKGDLEVKKIIFPDMKLPD